VTKGGGILFGVFFQLPNLQHKTALKTKLFLCKG